MLFPGFTEETGRHTQSWRKHPAIHVWRVTSGQSHECQKHAFMAAKPLKSSPRPLWERGRCATGFMPVAPAALEDGFFNPRPPLLSSCFLPLPSSFPRRRKSRNVAFGATRRHSLIGSPSAGENALDSRLRGNDGVCVSARGRLNPCLSMWGTVRRAPCIIELSQLGIGFA